MKGKSNFEGKYHTDKTRNLMSIKRKEWIKIHPNWNPMNDIEVRKRMSMVKIGTTHTKETKEKISKLKRGKNCPFWKGGITPINILMRQQMSAIQWRSDVFQRDNWTCQKCGDRNGNGHKVFLNAHHIKLFSKYPESRFDINNGITLCDKCHRGEHFYGNQI